MSAAETIAAAIEKLEQLTIAASYAEVDGWLTEASERDDWGHYEQAAVTNDPLMVTLHRTIDAQLAILTWFTASLELAPDYEPPEGNPFMSLARSILEGAA